jgi:hypothetical protein
MAAWEGGDDSNRPATSPEMNRREIPTRAGTGCLAAAMAGACGPMALEIPREK